MMRKIVGAAIGAKLAKNSPALGGATGAALATAVPFIIARASLPSLVMLGAAGYFLKRRHDQRESGEGKATYGADAAATGKPAR
jgi:hypothetical protein